MVAQELLLAVPTSVLFILVVGLPTVLAVAGVLVVRRRVPYKVLQDNNEVGGFFLSLIGVFYAILLAFTVIVVWEEFQSAARTAESEATTLDSIYIDAGLFPGDAGQQVRARARAYAEAIVRDDWPAMARAKGSPSGDKAMADLWTTFEQIQPRTAQENAFYTEMTHNLNELHTLRHQRILASGNGLPGVLWITIIGGGLMTVALVLFFGQRNLRVQMLMTGAVVASISYVIFVVLLINNPFTGDVSVRPDALDAVLREMVTGG